MGFRFKRPKWSNPTKVFTRPVQTIANIGKPALAVVRPPITPSLQNITKPMSYVPTNTQVIKTFPKMADFGIKSIPNVAKTGINIVQKTPETLGSIVGNTVSGTAKGLGIDLEKLIIPLAVGGGLIVLVMLLK